MCKGAVEEVLEICAQIGDENSLGPFTEPERKHLKALRDKLNAEGMRVVAVAWRFVAELLRHHAVPQRFGIFGGSEHAYSLLEMERRSSKIH